MEIIPTWILDVAAIGIIVTAITVFYIIIHEMYKKDKQDQEYLNKLK